MSYRNSTVELTRALELSTHRSSSKIACTFFGGKQSDLSFGADSWYRDDHYPSAIVREVPSPDLFWRLGSTFIFDSEEQGCFFEYRLWDPYAYMQLVPWTPVVKKADVAFLDWRMGGPGSGIYVLYVRAVDPAGNRYTSHSSSHQTL